MRVVGEGRKETIPRLTQILRIVTLTCWFHRLVPSRAICGGKRRIDNTRDVFAGRTCWQSKETNVADAKKHNNTEH